MEEKIPLVVTTESPLPEGVGDREPVPEDGPVYHAARVSKAAGLKDLEDEYAFYSHALLFTHARWGVDPVADYVRQVDPACQPFAIQLPEPAFSGLAVEGNPTWNHTVFAVRRPHWDGLRGFLASLSGVDRERKRYHRVAVQELPLADLLALEKMAYLPDPVPAVTVTLFALEGDWATVGYKPARQPPVDRIKVIERAAVRDVVKMRDALFAELAKPFQAVEPTVEEAERRAREKLQREGWEAERRGARGIKE